MFTRNSDWGVPLNFPSLITAHLRCLDATSSSELWISRKNWPTNTQDVFFLVFFCGAQPGESKPSWRLAGKMSRMMNLLLLQKVWLLCLRLVLPGQGRRSKSRLGELFLCCWDSLELLREPGERVALHRHFTAWGTGTNIDIGEVPAEVMMTKPGWQGLQPLPTWGANHKTLLWDISKCPALKTGLCSKAGRQHHLVAPGWGNLALLGDLQSLQKHLAKESKYYCWMRVGIWAFRVCLTSTKTLLLGLDDIISSFTKEQFYFPFHF